MDNNKTKKESSGSNGFIPQHTGRETTINEGTGPGIPKND